MGGREEFEKAYTDAFIGEELKGLESFIFARFEIGGEYARDKVATAYAMWQARVPEGYVVVPKEPTDIEIESIKEKHWSMRGCQLCKSDYIDLYKAMIEAAEK